MTSCFCYGWYHIGVNIYVKSNEFYYVQIAKVVNSKDVKGSNFTTNFRLFFKFKFSSSNFL